MKSKTLREDRTAAERKSAAVAPRRRRRILQAGFFFMFARHGRALTGVSPEHAQIVGSV